MELPQIFWSLSAWGPFALMVVAAVTALVHRGASVTLWRAFVVLSVLAMLAAVAAALAGPGRAQLPAPLKVTTLGLAMAVLVQFLGTVIGAFSARYLQGEAGQQRYVAAFASVLGAVHLLLMADHWFVLVVAWALVGVALQHLLCFYPDRSFAQLAAHKKHIADRVADVLLVCAAALAWTEVGEGSLSALKAHVLRDGMSPILQVCAVLLTLAVILRTALLPVHGWLIQVMEAPTPVSALLHAGVVNLGGFVLIRFATLLEHAMPARVLLVVFGLATAVLAGMVMLTRISIKVRLAWSTVAQMGFMLLECGLGLYTLAALHLIGHSLYKAHAFLSASAVVQQTRLQAMHAPARPAAFSLLLAPVCAVAAVLFTQAAFGQAAWPLWWSGMLGLAWAPMLWLRTGPSGAVGPWAAQGAAGVLMVAALAGATMAAHVLPLGIQDAPVHTLGWLALAGMVVLYGCLVLLQLRPNAMRVWRRWSYAGFYVDEAYTRLALALWPAVWARHAHPGSGAPMPPQPLAKAAP